MRTKDALKRLYILLTAGILITCETALALYVLNRYYNSQFRTQLYFRGHVLMALIFAALIIFSGRIFGGLLVGLRKDAEVIFSHFFTLLFSNAAYYVLLVLQSLKFPDVLPLAKITLLEIVFSICWIALLGKGYRKLFKPMDVLLVYQRGSAKELTERLSSRTDRLNITDTVFADEDMKEVKKKIDAHNTVMLWDISASKRNSIFKYCYENSKRIYSAPNISDIILNGAEPVNLFDTPLLLTEANPFEYEERVIKRLFDIILSLVLIILMSPLMLITACCIKISDRGPVFYRQIRCTKNAREFTMLKFRSMIVDAEKNGVAVLAKEKDPRITPVGAVIRKLRIDELPQLFNVLKGDMSFVGPRPERPEFIRKYIEDMPEFSYRMKIRAGITGYAQLYGKYNTKPYDKLKFDLYYMEQYSLWLDIRLIILTVKILFMKESTEGAKEDVQASGIDNNPGV
ncbi:MAG: exopolysaccharide biosynthesis polyprenyl glycosylphosphotransferase [Lachnospiraceae bacterium]|nr:exopolysaccharide biosynthesis polyprenyl glycosylphosphotransferase [Lachnospiraceae bacterium]